MRLRCFFGPAHGHWQETNHPETLVALPIRGATYRCAELVLAYDRVHDGSSAQVRYVLIADGHSVSEVIDWLFTFQADHPQHPDDANHPRELAKAGR